MKTEAASLLTTQGWNAKSIAAYINAVRGPLCISRSRIGPGNRLTGSRSTPFATSEVLFKPVVGIWLVVKGFYLLVPAVSVQLDGFNEGAVRFQVKDSDPCLPCGVLQRQKEPPSQPQAARSWSYPHALELPRSILVKLQRATADWLLSQMCHEQQSSWQCEFVRLRRNAESGIEPGLEALA